MGRRHRESVKIIDKPIRFENDIDVARAFCVKIIQH